MTQGKFVQVQQTDRLLKMFFQSLFNTAIIPPLAPVITFVPSQAITQRQSKSRLRERQNSMSPSKMSFAFPLFVEKRPT